MDGKTMSRVDIEAIEALRNKPLRDGEIGELMNALPALLRELRLARVVVDKAELLWRGSNVSNELAMAVRGYFAGIAYDAGTAGEAKP